MSRCVMKSKSREGPTSHDSTQGERQEPDAIQHLAKGLSTAGRRICDILARRNTRGLLSQSFNCE
jgi:hypothetical protein